MLLISVFNLVGHLCIRYHAFLVRNLAPLNVRVNIILYQNFWFMDT